MKPILSRAAIRLAQTVTDPVHKAFILDAVIAIAEGEEPPAPPPELALAWGIAEGEQRAMSDAYEAKVEQARAAGRASAQARRERNERPLTPVNARQRPLNPFNEHSRETKRNETKRNEKNRNETNGDASASPISGASAPPPDFSSEKFASAPLPPAKALDKYAAVLDPSLPAVDAAFLASGEIPNAAARNIYTALAAAKGERAFRQCLASFCGERESGELSRIHHFGRYLVSRLKALPDAERTAQ